jgi:hypothetical protein
MADDIARAFAAHDEDQANAWRRLSYRDRLRWLQGAKRFAKQATDAAAKRSEDRETKTEPGPAR